MTNTRYKLTNQDLTTHEGHPWVVGEWQEILTADVKICTADVFHYYYSPEQAVLFNPIHAAIQAPLLWEIECSEEVNTDTLKGACKRMRLVRQIPLPVITPEQRVAFAIYCAEAVADDPTWLAWASGWMSGEDRSVKAAAKAAEAWAAEAKARAAWAAEAVAKAAVAKARAAEAEAAKTAAAWTARAAEAWTAKAAEAAVESTPLDFQKIINSILSNQRRAT